METLKCSECGSLEKVPSGYALPHNGFFFSPREFGYYAGFSDNMPWQTPNKDEEVFLCHNCCIRLLAAFPSIAKAIGEGGHHPCDDEIPCCSYAWRATKDFGKKHDQELVRTQSPVFDEVTNCLKWQDDEPVKG